MMRFLRDTAFSLGYWFTPQVANDEVLQVIRSLRPRECGRALIRIGAVGDGGYLIPDDLEGIEYCFSPGVNQTADFEDQLAERRIKSFLADYSVPRPPLIRPEFVFDKKFLGATNSDTSMTLAAWRDKYLADYRGELVLQMDIEGAEYEVLLSTPQKLLESFRIIVLELHWLERLFDPFGYRIIKACMDRLLTDFYVVHAHPNNCSGTFKKDGVEVPGVLELTFYNRRRAAPGAYCTEFPHALDADNCPSLPSLPLPSCWR